MLRILHDTKYDFIKYWKTAALGTIGFIVLGMAILGIHAMRHQSALNYSVEFTGGTVIQLTFKQPPGADIVRTAVDQAGFTGAEVTQFGDPINYMIKVQPREGVMAAANADSSGSQIAHILEQRLGAGNKVTVARAEAVGPRVGSELKTKAITAILISFIVTLIYLAIRFEWRFGVAATIATMHDILTTLAFLAMMRLEISLTVVAAILTVIGYSLNDTIIIFDRVREDLRKGRKESLYDTLNRAINETLPRSILTHATTAAATLALLLFAGEVIRPFAWVMLFGIVTGTFSSVYIAGPVLIWIERKYPRNVPVAAWKGSSTATPTSRTKSSAATATR
jgi:preprotein translocase subunit SecF